MTAWYEDWFNSQEYLTVYSHRDQLEADTFAKTITGLLPEITGGKLLDMACGAGRHAIAFAKLGFQVTAVDLSPRLLETAARNARALDLEITFRRENLLSFTSDAIHSLVLNVFTSFGYFDRDEDNFRLFHVAYQALQSKGTFVFDYLNVSSLKKTFSPYSRDFFNNYIIEQVRSLSTERVEKTILIQSGTTLQTFRESVKLYTADCLETELRKAGFQQIRLLGDYSGGKFREDSSPRFIALCTKD